MLLAGIGLAAMLLPERPASAEGQPEAAAPSSDRLVQLAQLVPPTGQEYFDKDIDRLAKEARSAAEKGDPKAARSAISKLKKALELLRAGIKSGLTATAEARLDEGKLTFAVDAIEKTLAENAGPHTLEGGPSDASYGFFVPNTRDFAKQRLTEALAAAKKCDDKAFDAAVARLRNASRVSQRAADQAANDDLRSKYGADANALTRLADELAAAKAKLFEACKKPDDKSAEAPKRIEPERGPRTNVPPPPGDQAQRPPQGGSPFGPAFAPNVFVFEPNFGGGVDWFGGTGNYSSNGGQAPGSGTGSKDGGSLCGGFDAKASLPFGSPPPGYGGPPVIIGNPLIGIGIGYCEFIAANVLLFELDRHSGGLVSAIVKERNELYFEFLMEALFWVRLGNLAPQAAQIASSDSIAQLGTRGSGAYWPVRLKFGIGPVFRSSKLTLTSNQVPGGGVSEIVSQTTRQTGLGLVFGASTALCANCIFGNPLMFNVEGRIRHMPSRSIAVTSSTFGFTETATVDRRTTSSVMFKVSVPFGIGRY